MTRDSVNTDPVAELIDDLIQRGLQRVETEKPAVSIVDFLRLLPLVAETASAAENDNKIVWRDDWSLPDAA